MKRAEALFQEKGYTWQTVVKAFADKGLDESVALQNARLAKILTNDDYDSGRHSPILWTPSSDYRIDDGTAIQASENKGSDA